MQIESDKDFIRIRKQFLIWHKRFPMFKHDVRQIEKIIENHIQQYSKALVKYRQTHSKIYLTEAQKKLDDINRVLLTIGKLELVAILTDR